MYWEIFSLIAAFFVVRFLWQTWTLPAMTLGRQAARMHWIAVGRVDGGNGTKDVCYGRDGIEAAVSYQDGNVRLIHPMSDKVFPDFVELERWLASSHKGETATG